MHLSHSLLYAWWRAFDNVTRDDEIKLLIVTDPSSSSTTPQTTLF
jgi:hypothetical protein